MSSDTRGFKAIVYDYEGKKRHIINEQLSSHDMWTAIATLERIYPEGRIEIETHGSN